MITDGATTNKATCPRCKGFGWIIFNTKLTWLGSWEWDERVCATCKGYGLVEIP